MSEEPERKKISEIRMISALEGIRHRPAMYIGDTGMWGLIHYLVGAVAFSLERQATWITVTAGDLLEIHSNALVEVPLDSTQPVAGEDSENSPVKIIQRTSPVTFFEKYLQVDVEGAVLAALSEQFHAVIRTPTQTGEWQFRQGVLESDLVCSETSLAPEVTFRFKPDRTIFEVTDLAPAIFHSYFRRMSYLHGGVRFRFTTPAETHEYHAPGGLRELFEAVAAPMQYLHEPIHFTATKGELQLECVLACQSWSHDHHWCFINYGRTVEGGTHEEGLQDGLRRLRTEPFPSRPNGVVAVMALQYPRVTFQGCVKQKVANPELREQVSDLVYQGAMDWLKQHPEVKQQLSKLDLFTFPGIWFH